MILSLVQVLNNNMMHPALKLNCCHYQYSHQNDSYMVLRPS